LGAGNSTGNDEKKTNITREIAKAVLDVILSRPIRDAAALTAGTVCFLYDSSSSKPVS
jgi:hypothetical protein